MVDWQQLESEEDDCEEFPELFRQLNGSDEKVVGAALATLWESSGVDYGRVYDCFPHCLDPLIKTFLAGGKASLRSGSLAGRMLENCKESLEQSGADSQVFEIAIACTDLIGESESSLLSANSSHPGFLSVLSYVVTNAALLERKFQRRSMIDPSGWLQEFWERSQEPIDKAGLRMAANQLSSYAEVPICFAGPKELSFEERLVTAVTVSPVKLASDLDLFLALVECCRHPKQAIEKFAYGFPADLTNDFIFPWFHPNVVVIAERILLSSEFLSSDDVARAFAERVSHSNVLLSDSCVEIVRAYFPDRLNFEDGAEKLTCPQRIVLNAVIENDSLWGDEERFVNHISRWFGLKGLSSDRDRLASYLSDRNS
ncbi:hypothetical protein [Stieleria varia]|uniref:Uncharacterized protein n=1 Tax=Stieleria varia TaxID=2528005 RepID=A0A5C5ZP30_9BACT|nr:hypothetical protein [Stieleria varia]TWT89262.1 hypothetical protein Pla52n_68590 [Stieleria varia]